MIVELNGKRAELAAGTTVAAVVQRVGAAPATRGVAVAVGAEVVPRSDWERRRLSDGDRVEIVIAIQGG